MKMVHEVKNIKTKLPLFGININYGMRLAGLAVVVGLLYACDATFSVLVGIFLCYRVLRLVLRLLGLFFTAVFTVISILILIVIITLLIF